MDHPTTRTMIVERDRVPGTEAGVLWTAAG
jgi:hypothetical protein